MKYKVLRTNPNDPTKFEIYDENMKLVATAGTRRSARNIVRLKSFGLSLKSEEKPIGTLADLIKGDNNESEVFQSVQQ